MLTRRVTRSMTKTVEPRRGETLVSTTEDGRNSRREKKTEKKFSKRTAKVQCVKTISASRTPSLQAQRFGLIQERVAQDLYQLLVAATLWNRTRGIAARPVFIELIERYPSPEDLAMASEADLANLLRPIGLYNTKARRLMAFAKTWMESAPSKSRRYRKLHYPTTGCGRDIGAHEVLDEDDPREGWEVAHLPSIGPYALDCFRIFHRDMLRGLATDWVGTGAQPGFEPEWKRVVPLDKELKAYISWMWLKEGWIWDPVSGERVLATSERMKVEYERTRSLSPVLM